MSGIRNKQFRRKHPDRWIRRKLRHQNPKIKKRLFGHLFMIPCYHCHKVFLYEQLTVEHILPLSCGGTNDDENITLACAPCNQEQGRIVWLQKRKENRQAYEQYSSQHNRENWAITIQGA